MIKVRYRDQNEFAPGLHAATERQGRKTTVYLLSGLNAAQRRAALRRLKISARRGYGPRLPAPQLTLALLADRIRTAAGRTGAVFRSHPAGTAVPVMVVSAGAIAFLALSAVSIRVTHQPRDPDHVLAAAAGPAAPLRAGAGRLAARWVRPEPVSGTDRRRPERSARSGRLVGQTSRPTGIQLPRRPRAWRIRDRFSEPIWSRWRYDWKPGPDAADRQQEGACVKAGPLGPCV